jgi:hypothetical protein
MDTTTTTPKPTARETEMLPPPYTPPANGFFDDEEEEDFIPTTNITIHAPTNIHGSHNVITGPMMDPTRLAGLLISALNQKINGACGRQSNINIQINCGTNVVGEKNVFGSVGMRTRPMVPVVPAPAQGVSVIPEAVAASPVVLGKRKASEVCCRIYLSPLALTNIIAGTRRTSGSKTARDRYRSRLDPFTIITEYN